MVVFKEYAIYLITYIFRSAEKPGLKNQENYWAMN